MYLGKTVRQSSSVFWLFSLPPIRAPLPSEFEIYSHHTWLPCSPLSSQEVSEVFQSILNPEVMRFLHKKGFNTLNLPRAEFSFIGALTPPLSLLTLKPSEKLPMVTAKENPELPQLNLGLIVSENSGEPLYYKSSGRFNF